MSHHISNAANIIQSRYTGPVLPFNDSEDQQAVIEVPRDQYLVWMRNEGGVADDYHIIRGI
jgi:hypothetical protein